jgi:hypothetical protein
MDPTIAASCCWSFQGFSGLRQSDLRRYKDAWMYFELVQGSNAQISTANGPSGILSFPYIHFDTYESQNKYTFGQYLHQQIYPTENFQSIAKK